MFTFLIPTISLLHYRSYNRAQSQLLFHATKVIETAKAVHTEHALNNAHFHGPTTIGSGHTVHEVAWTVYTTTLRRYSVVSFVLKCILGFSVSLKVNGILTEIYRNFLQDSSKISLMFLFYFSEIFPIFWK